jgi:hypothetical protein
MCVNGVSGMLSRLSRDVSIFPGCSLDYHVMSRYELTRLQPLFHYFFFLAVPRIPLFTELTFSLNNNTLQENKREKYILAPKLPHFLHIAPRITNTCTPTSQTITFITNTCTPTSQTITF